MPIAPDTPGVFLQRGDRGRTGVSVMRTDIAGFAGIAEKGPILCAVRIETMRQFETMFGSPIAAGLLAYSVRAFFENGGRRCLITRVAETNEATGAVAAECHIPSLGGDPGLTIRASSPGSWGNGLSVRISPAWRAETILIDPPINAVYLDVPSTAGFSAGCLVRLGQAGAPDRYHVLSAVDAGAGRLYFIHPDPARRRPTDRGLSGLLAGVTLRIERLEYDIAISRDGMPIAVHAGLGLVPGQPDFIADVLRPIVPDAEGLVESPPPQVTVLVPERPAGSVPMPLDVVPGAPLMLSGGRDGLAELSADAFIGALGALAEQRDVSILAVPDIVGEPVRRLTLPWTDTPPDPCAICPPPVEPFIPLPAPAGEVPPRFDDETIARVQAMMIAQCEQLKDRIALIDPPLRTVRADAVGLAAVRAWRDRFDSAFAALFLPWIAVPDPMGSAPLRLVPPSGHVAGQLAATDLAAGPHKAAANVVLSWTQALSLAIDPAAHGSLNQAGMNAIVARDGRAPRIMGARTLSSDPVWRFLPVRRFVCMLRRALDAATQWAVFEPNSAETRALLTQSIGIFLETLRRGGALAGDRPADSFRVRCDDSNNPARGRADGELVVDIAVAPAVPLEFIILRLGRRDAAFELAEQGALALDTVGAV